MSNTEYKIYEKVKLENIAADIQCRMTEMMDDGDLPEGANVPSPESVERWLSHHDLFWDIYWDAVTTAIKEAQGV